MKVTIVGGGASGLISAIFSANNNDVTILERNSKCLKKLLLTGNGRCNYWNENINYTDYITSDEILLKDIITSKNKKKILDFFDKIGIISKIKNGYYYPFSESSLSIYEALLKEAFLRGVKIINDFYVNDIVKNGNGFIINPSKENIKTDKLIISTGSYAYPVTGSDGFMYKIFKNYEIVKPLPALTYICTDIFKGISKIRCDVKLSLIEDGVLINNQLGQLQINKDNISGICVFNLSGFINRGLFLNKKEEIIINFLPFTNDAFEFLKERCDKVTGRSVLESLETILNYKLALFLIKKAGINPDKYLDELSNKQLYKLAKTLSHFSISVTQTGPFEHSQSQVGGIRLNQINTSTMESKKDKNLFFTGEILDVCGFCGGYNLAFAFISGMLAGKGVNND